MVGLYDIELVENATKQLIVSVPGVNTAVGWSAFADIRSADSPSAPLLDTFTVTLHSDGISLLVTLTLTELSVNEIVRYVSTGRKAYYSLKLVKPDSSTVQIIKGKFTAVRTVTS